MQPGSLLDGRFRIRAFVAAGGMGSVYRADDLERNLPVAIKRFPTSKAFFSERFARESQVLEELRHPSIVAFVSQGLGPDGAPYIAMEWVEGTTLREVLKARRLTIEEAVSLCRRVAEALDETHRRGLLHLDLKPGNLMLLPGQGSLQVKVLDFGLAVLANETGRSDRIQGTLGYMSPEQARREVLTGATDIFSLGCVLYQALTQVPAFDGADASATLTKVVAGEPEPLGRLRPRTPQRLTKLVERMLAKRPEERPSLDEISAELDGLGSAPRAEEVARSDSITLDEQRITALVVARDPRGSEVRSRLHFSNLAQLGFQLSVLLDGTIVGTLKVWVNPLEAAVLAARAGLRMASLLPDARITVGLGQIRRGAESPDAAALDEAFQRLEETPAGAVSVDESIALLSAERFEVASSGSIWLLEGNRAPVDEPRPLLGRITPLLGREAEIRELSHSFLETLREGSARLHLIVGEAGSGKSRLLWHGLGEPTRRDAVILRARGEQDHFHAMGVWRRLVEDWMMGRAPEAEDVLKRLPQPSRTSLEALLRQEKAEDEDPSAVASRVRSALGDWLQALLVDQPVALIIDDVHHLDTASRDTLRGLMKRAETEPFWVLGAGSPQAERMFADCSPHVIRLAPMKDDAAAQLVEWSLGPSCDRPARDRIVEQAQGNPFLLEELIRAASRGESDQVPKSVLGLAQARLSRLSPATRRVLRAASIFGNRFFVEAVCAVLSEPEGSVRTALEEAVTAEFLKAPEPDSSEFGFRHGLLREAAYRSFPTEERALAHGRAAEHLERCPESSPLELARQWEQAGRVRQAVPHLRRAAENALEANNLDAAHALARQGLAREPERGDAGALHLVLAEVRAFRGDLGRASDEAQQVLRLVPAGEPAWFRALTVLATCAGLLGFPSLIRQVWTLLQGCDGPPTSLSVAATSETVLAYLRVGLAPEAEPVLDSLSRQRAAMTPHPDLRSEGFFRTARAAWDAAHGDVSSALEHRVAAAEAFRAGGDVRRACRALGEAGCARLMVGDVPGARAQVEEAHREARRVGLPHTEAQLSRVVGIVLARDGQNQEAMEALSRSARSCHALKDIRGEGMARAALAAVLRSHGRAAAARTEAERAVHLLSDFAPDLAHALAVQARLELDRNDVARGLELAQSALENLENGGPVEMSEMFVRWVHAQALEAAGRLDASKEALEQARARILKRAEALRNPTLKTGYLVRVPEHAGILSMARRRVDGASIALH